VSASEIGLCFVLLENGPVPSGSELTTRPVAVAGGEVRLGIDSRRFRHVLVPVHETMREDRSSAALILSSRLLEVGGSEQLFADLYCTDLRLGMVFERLAADVHDRINGGEPAAEAMPNALSDWRDLFRGGSSISPESVLGLVGELTVLERLAEAVGIQTALDSWWGPDKHPHDFYSASAQAIEVKTTRSLGGNRISISNIAQLDPTGLDGLYLSVLRTKLDPTAPTLDERISGLLARGFPAAELLTKIERAGYVFEGVASQTDTRYAVLGHRWWHVTDDFPGIRASRVEPDHMKGVMTVKYELALDSVPSDMATEQVEALIAGWGK